MSDCVSIVPYRGEYRAAFDRLNRAWVSEHFVVEPGDEAELTDPYGYFVLSGGQVLFLVTAGGEVVGSVALLKHGTLFEVAKMTVDERFRGRGFGDRLMEAAAAYARAEGATVLELVSNTKLEAAIRLYRKHGFIEVPLGPREQYARANIRMRYEVAPAD